MPESEFQNLAVLGVGLLGGSVGLALKRRNAGARVVGSGRRQSSLDAALAVGAIDAATLDPAEAVAEADLVLLATPVGAFEPLLRRVAPALATGALVTDVGSTKADVVALAERVLGADGPFVGSHPMAGSEQKGPDAARVDLFDGARCILTPTATTDPGAVTRVETFWRELGMETLRMAPADHDRAVARVSHLPHALASLLMQLPDEADLALAATGFRDTTRLASGDPEMWRDIFLTNRPAVLAGIDRFAARLAEFRALVDAGDGAGLEAFLADAKTRRDTTIAPDPGDTLRPTE